MRILVAEDEPVARLVIEAAIRKLGHECLGAVDGQQAWELLQSSDIDVIISDWRMPRVDGQELCKRVRSCDDSRSYIPFIFLTALDDKRHALMAMEAGADDYLVKPLNIDDLHARLISAQRLKRVEDERRHLLIEERHAREEAEAAVRARDDVLAAVSHDLRTPLTAIHALGQVLHTRLARLQPDAQAAPLMHFADRIVDSAMRMNTWIDDLMAATRSGVSEPVLLNPESLDLVDLVQCGRRPPGHHRPAPDWSPGRNDLPDGAVGQAATPARIGQSALECHQVQPGRRGDHGHPRRASRTRGLVS